MSSSSATSLMVRKASGALSTAVCSPVGDLGPGAQYTSTRTELIFGFVGNVSAVDALLKDGRGLEHHDAAGRDRHFLAGLRITADPLPLLTDHERAERRQLHR